MAQYFQVATGSKKITELDIVNALSSSGTGSMEFTILPIVMGGSLNANKKLIDGNTKQITVQSFISSSVLNVNNTFTATNTFTAEQNIITTSGKKVTRLTGDGITIFTGSALGSATDGFKVDSIGGGVKLYSYDKSGSPQFRTFLTVGTDNGDVTLTKNVLATGNLNVAGDLGIGGDLNINENLVVGGTITAQSYNTEFISQSIIFESGSTVFGNSNDDTHQRTGSLLVSGSSSVIGNSYVSGIVQNALLGAVTQSLITQNVSQGSINSLNFVVTQSLITQNTSQAGVNTLISAVTTSLLAQTASQGLVNDLTLAVTSSLITQNTSQGGVNLGISIVTASLNAYTASGATSTSNINSFTASQLAVNDLTLAVTSSLITQNTSQGLVNNLTQAVTSSLITQNTSQGAVNLAISGVTASLINQNTSQGLVNNLTQAVTSSLITQNTSQGLVNTLTSAVTQSLINQNTSQGAVNLTISGITASLINQNTSQGLVNNLTLAVTSSLITQNTSQGLVNNLTLAVTSSLIGIVGELQAYTASLKGAAIVSSSQQITNYYKFAETASANTFYGNQTISGSLNVSSSANLTGSIVINQLTYPTADFADGQYGVEVPTLATNNVFSMEIPKTVYEYVKNDSGVTLLKGTPVHSTGTVGFNTLVIAASASVASTMPATYILAQDLDDEEEGLGIAIGAIQGVNTTGLIAGDAVYVGASGGWTQTKPTGSNLIQNLGIVTKVGNNGGGVVLGAGRANDVPNIQEGYFWVGNSGSVATPTPTSSFALTGSNIFIGNQTITGSLNVTGSVNINNVITMTPVTTLPVGQAGMLVASSSYGSTNLYMYDGAAWKWLVTGSIV
jgi:hypothetical protein